MAEREIEVPPLGSELAYLVALHEIGHVVLGLASSARMAYGGGTLIRLYDNEATLWEWAFDDARIAPSADDEEKFVTLLRMSIQRCRHRLRRHGGLLLVVSAS